MEPARPARRRARLAAAGAALLALALLGLRLRTRRAAAHPLSEPLRRGRVVESVYGIGTVTAAKSFSLKPGVTTTIRGLWVKEGDEVARGQRLVDLDGATFAAPFAGTVTFAPFKIGETVFMQAIVVSVVDLRDRYVVVSLEQRASMRVRRGQKAKLSFENARERVYEGRVEAVYSNEGGFLVRIGVAGLAPEILPGMTADVAIAVDERDGVLTIPIAAIEDGRVRVMRPGAAKPLSIPVKTGLADEAAAEVVEGELGEGDRLVLPAPAR